MPSRYAWIALGLGAYVAFALSTFPATAAYRWFAPPELRMSGIEGTLWSGRAALASAGGLPLTDLRWSLDALPLLTARAAGRAQARLADGFVDTLFSASPTGRVVLRNTQVSASLAALAPVAPVGDVAGQLSIALERIELEDGWPIDAVGRARVGNLAAPTFIPGGQGDLIPLGDYELTFDETGGEGLLGRFRDTGGPLEVSGALVLDRQGRYRLEGAASPRSGAPRELVQALDFIAGEPGADGGRPFELTGSL
jgi:general secretion pathway protein N